MLSLYTSHICPTNLLLHGCLTVMHVLIGNHGTFVSLRKREGGVSPRRNGQKTLVTVDVVVNLHEMRGD